MRQAFPADVRAKALAIYLESGPAEASRQTGVPTGTVSQWARRKGVTLTRSLQTLGATEASKTSRESRLERLAETLVTIAYDRAEWIKLQAPSEDTRAPMTVAAIAIDKAQLLTGKATVRVETVTPEVAAEYTNLLELKRAS